MIEIDLIDLEIQIISYLAFIAIAKTIGSPWQKRQILSFNLSPISSTNIKRKNNVIIDMLSTINIDLVKINFDMKDLTNTQ